MCNHTYPESIPLDALYPGDPIVVHYRDKITGEDFRSVTFNCLALLDRQLFLLCRDQKKRVNFPVPARSVIRIEYQVGAKA
jgi:hypothetical protein